MKFPIIALTASVLPVLAGCSGVHYASESKPTDLVAPTELRYAVPAGPYKNDLTTLVGTFAVYNKAEHSLQVLEPVANNYDPRTRPVTETVKQTLYKSVVTPAIQTEIPLIKDALKDAGGENLDVTITDEAHAMVPGYSVDLLHYLGSRYHPTSPDEEIVYVAEAWQRGFNAALLTAKPHSGWSANNGVVVYNNATYVRTDNFKDGSYLTVSVVPFSAIQSAKPGQTPEPLPVASIASIKPQVANPYAYTWQGEDWRFRHGAWGWGSHGYKPAVAK